MWLHPNQHSRTRPWLHNLLAVWMALPYAANSQIPAQPAIIEDLRVIALAGNGATNDLEHKIMSPLVIQVLDQEGRPIEGAQVIFRFPLNGPSALFPDQQNAQTTRTNADGQAAAVGWIANNFAGTFQVQVTATRGNQMGQATISMTNANRVLDESKNPGGKKKSWWSSKSAKVVVIAVVAGAIAGIVLATHNSGNSNGTVITGAPGTPTIGAPQ